MKFKEIWDRLLTALTVLAFFVFLFCIIACAVLADHCDSKAFEVITMILLFDVIVLPMILLYCCGNKQRNHRKSELDVKELRLKEQAAELAGQASELKEKAAKLTEQEAHINDLLREREVQHIRSIANREHLASSPVFQAINTEEDQSRLFSAMTQDMNILPPLRISAKIHSQSGSVYDTSLAACSCTDFKNRKTPCKHMYRLAAEFGILFTIDYKTHVLLRHIAQLHLERAKIDPYDKIAFNPHTAELINLFSGFPPKLQKDVLAALRDMKDK